MQFTDAAVGEFLSGSRVGDEDAHDAVGDDALAELELIALEIVLVLAGIFGQGHFLEILSRGHADPRGSGILLEGLLAAPVSRQDQSSGDHGPFRDLQHQALPGSLVIGAFRPGGGRIHVADVGSVEPASVYRGSGSDEGRVQIIRRIRLQNGGVHHFRLLRCTGRPGTSPAAAGNKRQGQQKCEDDDGCVLLLILPHSADSFPEPSGVPR